MEVIFKNGHRDTYPETLFACKIRMPRISPEPTSNKATFRVAGSPVEPRSWPLFLWVISFRICVAFFFSQISVFIGVECKLLVVRSKFKRQDGKGDYRKNIVRGDEGCMRLEDRR